MTDTERIRFDQAALENHADEYCNKEAKLAHELVEMLRIAASCAPMEYISRTRRIMNEADRLARYFSKMEDALIESGQLVEQLSKAVLERLEDAEEKTRSLL